MDEKLPVRQWQEKFRAGAFHNSDCLTMEAAGWYHWNCSTESLAGRLKKLSHVAMGITHPFILDNYFVLCRNLSSRFDKLYDEIGFVPLVEEDQWKCFWVTLDDPYRRKKWSLFTGRYGEDAPEFDCGDIRVLIRYINRIGPELEQGMKPPFVQEKQAAAIYAHRFHGEPWEISIYRNGEHQYSYRSKLDGRERMIMVTADLKDAPPDFVSDRAEQYRGFYFYCPEDAEQAVPSKDRPKPSRRKEAER